MDIERQSAYCEMNTRVIKEINDKGLLNEAEFYALWNTNQNAMRFAKDYDHQDGGAVAARVFEDYINSSQFNNNSFVKGVTSRMHRYLQGKMMDVILKIIKTYATYPDYKFDGRNEQCQKLCEAIVKNNPEIFEYINGLGENV